MWVVGGNFGSRINILNLVLIKYFRIFLDFWGFEDKVGYISFTRNYTGPQGIFASSVSNWRSTQQFLPDRDTRYASCQIWPFHVISVKVISVIIGNSLKNLFWSFAGQYANNSMVSEGPLAFSTSIYMVTTGYILL